VASAAVGVLVAGVLTLTGALQIFPSVLHVALLFALIAVTVVLLSLS